MYVRGCVGQRQHRRRCCCMQGTSSSEGAALSGALLEHFAQLGCTGIFASHLFELFELPLQPQLMQRVQLKTVRESEREREREREQGAAD
jgi:DNA mismatch repair ATPase MutS